ncbi:MAG: hypothetical protein GXX96_26110 [Planctomycetaceae bacterium]|nr:hypothetical protein [Planctomycetaceae bacterium]
MCTLFRWVAVLGILVGCSAAAWGRDIHVNNLAGNDRYLGIRPESLNDQAGPVKTIARALEIAIPGDRIVLANTGQPYRESLTLFGSRHSGSETRPLTIQGNGVILEGADEIDADSWQHVYDNVFRFRPRHLAYQQLFLDHRPLVRILCTHPCTTPPELQPLEWCLYGGHIYFRAEPMKRPEDYALTVATRPVGITLFHVQNVAILDLTIQGFQLDAVNAHNSARDIVLQEVTCRGNGRAGVAVGGASVVTINSSLLGNNGEAQLLTNPYSETFVRQSNLLSNTAPAWLDRGGVVIVDDKRVEGGIDDRQADDKEAPAES